MPQDQVMDMRPANVNVVKRAEVAGRGVGPGARDTKGEKESDRRKEKPPFRPIGDMLVKEPANARMVQNPEDDCGSHKKRQSEQPGPDQHDSALSYQAGTPILSQPVLKIVDLKARTGVRRKFLIATLDPRCQFLRGM
jgi:hypothetical protein